MTIKNLDGTPFQLARPNPLLKTQDISPDAHVIHNFVVKEIVVQYNSKPKSVQPVGAVFGTPTPQPILRKQLTVEEYAPKTEEYVQPKPQEQKPENSIVCWCLPGNYKTFQDGLYGETRNNPVFGDKFRFNGVVVEMNEMSFKIWADMKIMPPSIIFIAEQKRWWRVVAVNMQEEGFIMECMPSDVRPRFD